MVLEELLIQECGTNELNRQFSKEVQRANKYMKKHSISLHKGNANQND
jgi:hypothetical protein